MTGQSQKIIENESFEISVQLKSLNHRFRDIKWKAPSILSMHEIQTRKILEQYFKRGSFDVYIHIKFKEKLGAALSIDLEKVKSFVNQFKEIDFPFLAQTELTQFLRSEFLQESSQETQKIIAQEVLRAVKECSELLLKERVEEGEKIKKILHKNLQDLKASLSSIQEKKLETLENKKKKIQDRLNELSGMKNIIDENRLAQEFVYWGQKYDIQEEIDRFLIHCSKFESCLVDDPKKMERGKELEFLLQELGREINTLANKSDNALISHEGVSIKCILESMREQVLNIE